MKTKLILVLTELELQVGPSPQLLAILNPKIYPSQAALRDACGSLEIIFDHYPPTPQLLAYLNALHQHWPYAAYFCPPQSSFLTILYFALQAPHATIVHSPNLPGPNGPFFRLVLPGGDVGDEIWPAMLQTIADLGQQAGMSPAEIKRKQLEFAAGCHSWKL